MRKLLTICVLAALVLLFAFGQQEAFDQGKIYWTAGGHSKGIGAVGCPSPGDIATGPFGQIQSANLDGTNVQTLVANTNTLGSIRPTGIALDGGQLYWADFYCGIYVVDSDGSSPGPVVKSPWYALQGIAVGAGQLYWGSTHAGFGGDSARIRRANFDASGMQVLIQNAVGWFPGLLAMDDVVGNKIYWGDVSNGGLFWSNLDGSGRALIVGGLPVRGIAVDAAGGRLYFTTASAFGGGGRIFSANLDGTGLVQIIAGLNFPYGIAVDPGTGKIYWSDINDGVIREANTDGSGQVVLIPGLVSPAGIAIQPNQPPTADAGSDQTVEQDSYAGASVTLDGSGSYDPDGDPLTYTWTWDSSSASGVNPTVTLPLGKTTVTLTVSDGQLSDTDTVDITVEDTTDPDVAIVAVVPEELWPPNHRMVPVIVTIEASDICTETDLLEVSVNVTSNEPDDDKGDGAFTGDVDGQDGYTAPVPVLCEFDGDTEYFVCSFELRAERDGRGVDRIYTITATVKDASDNETTASCEVIVPHDQGKGKK